MEGSSADFSQRLETAVKKRALWIEENLIPQLGESIRAYQTHFETIVGLLIRKGLFREDPYNYEQAVSELAVPPDTPLPELERSDESSYRLAAYRRQIEFLSSTFRMSLETLDLARLKKILGLLLYINWTDLGEGTKSPMTRAFNRALTQVRLGTDMMATAILKDSLLQIDKFIHQSRQQIAELVSFQRESWKSDLRLIALARTPIPPTLPRGGREELSRTIRKSFNQAKSGKPWYPKLVDEVICEEIDPDGAERKEKILASLAIQEKTPPTPKAEETKPDNKQILLEAVRILCRTQTDLKDIIEKLMLNSKSLQSNGTGFGGRLKRLFSKGGGQEGDELLFQVEYQDPTVNETRTETINFPQFITEVQKKVNLLVSLSKPDSLVYKKLSEAAEGQIADFIDKQIRELMRIHRRMGGIGAMFVTKAMKSGQRALMKGIKPELLSVRNAILKANKKRHEYEESGG